jgi:hypothetical protein
MRPIDLHDFKLRIHYVEKCNEQVVFCTVFDRFAEEPSLQVNLATINLQQAIQLTSLNMQRTTYTRFGIIQRYRIREELPQPFQESIRLDLQPD